MDGVLIVNKPPGMTSHDVVAQVRRITGEKSVGHLGTLDPMATGVLPLLLGRFTRLAQFYTEADKSYAGAIRFGWATTTYDKEGERVGEPKEAQLTLEQLREAGRQFVGDLEQMPPPFSAKKVNGVPAYKLARRGAEVPLKPKPVKVHELTVTSWDGKEAQFQARVSSGTYVRSIAHEMGQRLGCGAHLSELTRTAVREFVLEEAHELSAVDKASAEGVLEKLVLHARMVLPELPAVTAPPEALARVRNGGAVNLPEYGNGSLVRVFAGQRELVAIARRVAGTLFQPKVVLQI